jgi:hypothetical protein
MVAFNPQDRPNPKEKLVKVLDTERESEALVVSGLLESAGIDNDVTAIDAAQNMYPGVGGTVVLVREEDADEARRIIDEYRRSGTGGDIEEVDTSSEEPQAG